MSPFLQITQLYTYSTPVVCFTSILKLLAAVGVKPLIQNGRAAPPCPLRALNHRSVCLHYRVLFGHHDILVPSGTQTEFKRQVAEKLLKIVQYFHALSDGL
jgi:hypothetical protein